MAAPLFLLQNLLLIQQNEEFYFKNIVNLIVPLLVILFIYLFILGDSICKQLNLQLFAQRYRINWRHNSIYVYS